VERPQAQRRRVFEHMHRPGIAIQLRGERERHATPGEQVRRLLLRERLDPALLKSRIRLRGRAVLVVAVLGLWVWVWVSLRGRVMLGHRGQGEQAHCGKDT
jgi:hypothetical protein